MLTNPSSVVADEVEVKQATDIADTPGIYIIRCAATGAAYVGSTNLLRRRLRRHFSKLDSNHGEVYLMQQDWNRYGECGFEVWIFPCTAYRSWIETQLILHFCSLEDHGGYNRMFGSHWGLHARICDIESKLRRSGKFVYLRGDNRVRLGHVYAQTFTRHVDHLSKAVAQIQDELTSRKSEKQLPAILAALQRVSIHKLRKISVVEPVRR